MNLYRLFESRFEGRLEDTFLETIDGDRLTYADLADGVGRHARVLVDGGVGLGDRVLVQAEKSVAGLFLYLACLRVGAVFIPLNTSYRRDEVRYFLDDAEPSLVVCDPSSPLCSEDAADVERTVLTLDVAGGGSLSARARAAPPTGVDIAEVPGDHTAAILYTSGTTGQPKGAMLTHDNLASNAKALHEAWGFVDDDVLLHALPIFHTHGLFVALHCVLLNATGMLFLPRFDLDSVLRLLPRATVMMGVPTYYTRLLASPEFTAELCGHMRLFVSGSAPLRAETFEQFQRRTGHAILERYGMTETGMNTSNPLAGPRIAGTVGRPLPGVEVRVCESDGTPLAAGAVGELEVRGPNVFKGYWRKPDKTRAEFRDDGFFRTGDLGLIDENGYVTIVGRSKDMIISGGFNVYPKEIENAIDRLPGVRESAVFGVAHPDFGEGVAAAVVLEDGGGDAGHARALIARLKDRLAGYKVPKRIVFVAELPRNAMGKVEKNRLRETFADLFSVTEEQGG